mmetsp:Transcript_8753/g.32358  ORF Transcript_8753/g.32358 Transcript_8753/m.32358 type:complete len:204 (-) Transcript_8753:695-1306(-)
MVHVVVGWPVPLSKSQRESGWVSPLIARRPFWECDIGISVDTEPSPAMSAGLFSDSDHHSTHTPTHLHTPLPFPQHQKSVPPKFLYIFFSSLNLIDHSHTAKKVFNRIAVVTGGIITHSIPPHHSLHINWANLPLSKFSFNHFTFLCHSSCSSQSAIFVFFALTTHRRNIVANQSIAQNSKNHSPQKKPSLLLQFSSATTYWL